MNIEHPDITSALATGYPRGSLGRELPRCNRCRVSFMEYETAYLIEGLAYCEDCFPQELIENTPTIDLIEMFGITQCPAEELAL